MKKKFGKITGGLINIFCCKFGGNVCGCAHKATRHILPARNLKKYGAQEAVVCKWCGPGRRPGLSVHILPARKIRNMGLRKLWCASCMGVEGDHAPPLRHLSAFHAHTFLDFDWRENLAGEIWQEILASAGQFGR